MVQIKRDAADASVVNRKSDAQALPASQQAQASLKQKSIRPEMPNEMDRFLNEPFKVDMNSDDEN